MLTKKKYSKKDTTPGNTLKKKNILEDGKIEILISSREDGNMDPRFSSDALTNFHLFLEKHGFFPEETFSPALGLNYQIITINDQNEEIYAGRFIKNGTPLDEYHCDATIICESNIPVAFRVGDCPIVLIAGEIPGEQKIMALVHAGRGELMADMLKKTVNRMISDFQMHLFSATAYVFPHICKRCYALEYLDQAFKEKAARFLEFFNGRFHVDLLKWTRQQLQEAGLRRVVTAYFRCTAGMSTKCVSRLLHYTKKFGGLFSHYKSVHKGVPEGRFLVVARIVEEKNFDEED